MRRPIKPKRTVTPPPFRPGSLRRTLRRREEVWYSSPSSTVRSGREGGMRENQPSSSRCRRPSRPRPLTPTRQPRRKRSGCSPSPKPSLFHSVVPVVFLLFLLCSGSEEASSPKTRRRDKSRTGESEGGTRSAGCDGDRLESEGGLTEARRTGRRGFFAAPEMGGTFFPRARGRRTVNGATRLPPCERRKDVFVLLFPPALTKRRSRPPSRRCRRRRRRDVRSGRRRRQRRQRPLTPPPPLIRSLRRTPQPRRQSSPSSASSTRPLKRRERLSPGRRSPSPERQLRLRVFSGSEDRFGGGRTAGGEGFADSAAVEEATIEAIGGGLFGGFVEGCEEGGSDSVCGGGGRGKGGKLRRRRRDGEAPETGGRGRRG
jgi:hypothetical protein